MKKTLLIILALVVVGGGAFLTISNTSLFKGAINEQPVQQDGTSGEDVGNGANAGTNTTNGGGDESVSDLINGNVVLGPDEGLADPRDGLQELLVGDTLVSDFLIPDYDFEGQLSDAYVGPASDLVSTPLADAQDARDEAQNQRDIAQRYQTDTCDLRDDALASTTNIELTENKNLASYNAAQARAAANEAQAAADDAAAAAEVAQEEYDDAAQEETDGNYANRISEAWSEYNNVLALYNILQDALDQVDSAGNDGEDLAVANAEADNARANYNQALSYYGAADLDEMDQRVTDLMAEAEEANQNTLRYAEILDLTEAVANEAQTAANRANSFATQAELCANEANAYSLSADNNTNDGAVQYSCSDLSLTITSSTDTSLRLQAEVTLSAESNSTSSLFENIKASLLAVNMTPQAGTQPTAPWSGRLVLSTSGSGSFSNNQIPLSQDNRTATSIYSNGADGDTLQATVLGSNNQVQCSTTYQVPDGTLAKVDSGTDTNTDTNTNTNTDTNTDTTTNTDTNTNTDTTTDTNTNTNTNTNTSTNTASGSEYADIFINSDCRHPFTDLRNHWGESFIACMYEAGILEGYADGTFRPDQPITNGEWVKVMTLLSNFDKDDANGFFESFPDVSERDWFYDYYVIAQRENVVRPVEGPAYPNSNALRGDAVLWFIRMADQQLWGWTQADIPFTDLSTSDYFTYAMIIANRKQVYTDAEGWAPVFQGYEDGSSRAYNNISRAEAVALAIRMHLAYFAE